MKCILYRGSPRIFSKRGWVCEVSFTEAPRAGSNRGGGVCEVYPLQRLPGQDPIEGVGSVKCPLQRLPGQDPIEGVGSVKCPLQRLPGQDPGFQ